MPLSKDVGMPLRGRYLIVNADDFGMSAGVNRGIVEAHERGIVTSASLMVRWPAAPAAAAYALCHPDLSLGLHVDLGEWTSREGAWEPVYEVTPVGDEGAVVAEVDRQLEAFRQLTGRSPTHLDSHQHVHREERVRSLLASRAFELGAPLRDFSATVRYRGDFYGRGDGNASFPEAISFEAMLEILKTLEPGVTELGCHPGYVDVEESYYGRERSQEVNVLCDPRVREAIEREGIELWSFSDLIG